MRSSEIDPRTKLFLVLCLSSLGIFITDVRLLGIVFLFSLSAALSFRADLLGMLHQLRQLMAMIIAIAIAQSVFAPSGAVLLSVGQMVLLTAGGLAKSAEFILRMLIVLSSAAILSTANSRQIVQGLVQLKLPYELAFMSSLGIRFLPMLREGFGEAVTAIQLRGVDLSRIRWKDKLGTYLAILHPVIVSVILKSQRIAMSIELRGFRAFAQRTSFRVLEMKGLDYAVLLGRCSSQRP